MSQPPPLPDQVHLSWEARIHLLNNPSIWKSLLLAFGLPSLLLGILFAFIAQRPEFALLIPLVATGGLLFLFVLVGAVIDLFGGFKVIYVLSSTGVRSLSGRVAKATSATAVLAGLLSGNLTVAGAGFLAESEQNVFIPWSAVTAVKVKRGGRYLHIKREWGFKPIGMLCTPENSGQVLEIVRAYVADKVK
jgi:hypothetical protein